MNRRRLLGFSSRQAISRTVEVRSSLMRAFLKADPLGCSAGQDHLQQQQTKRR